MRRLEEFHQRLYKTKGHLVYGDPFAYQDLYILYIDVVKKLNNFNLDNEEVLESTEVDELKQLESELEELIDEYYYLFR